MAFLRAINVGGHTVKMDYLRSLFTDIGFTNVRSYIQTGNIFFETPSTDRVALTELIERHLETTLGYEVITALRTVEEVEAVIELDPFKNVAVTPDIRLCVAFISQPLPTLELPHHSPKGDADILSYTDGEVFVVARIINGKPGNLTAYLEKTFGVSATVRFFGTTIKILEAAKTSS